MTQPTTMIVNMAKAMLRDDLSPNRRFDAAWRDEGPAWIASATAALRTLLEPGEEMIEAAAFEITGYNTSYPEYAREYAREAIVEAIRAALGEGDPA